MVKLAPFTRLGQCRWPTRCPGNGCHESTVGHHCQWAARCTGSVASRAAAGPLHQQEQDALVVESVRTSQEEDILGQGKGGPEARARKGGVRMGAQAAAESCPPPPQSCEA